MGNAAKRKVNADLGAQHRVVSTSHPSPLSAAKGRDAFMGVRLLLADQRAFNGVGPAAGAWTSVKETGEADVAAALDFQVPTSATQSAAHVLPAKGETAFARPHARMVEKRSLVFPPSHTQVDWRLYVEGEEEADAAALLADVFGGGAAEDADEAAAAPACGWPRFDAALRALRDAAPVARDEAEDAAPVAHPRLLPAWNHSRRSSCASGTTSRRWRRAQWSQHRMVSTQVAPRTPGDIVDAAVDRRPSTAAEFASRAQDDVESTLREARYPFPCRRPSTSWARPRSARASSAATSRAGRGT